MHGLKMSWTSLSLVTLTVCVSGLGSVACGGKTVTVGKLRSTPYMTSLEETEMLGLNICEVLCVNYLERVENYWDYIDRLRGEKE